MGWHLTVGPPGSGRTTRMIGVARDACSAGERVWYVGLPAQRATILRRITADGFTPLGLEVMSAQQLYYRLLTGGGDVEPKPLVVGNGRLVRVAEALREVTGALPSPGEARLFAAAIAEAKRFAVAPERLASAAGADAEAERLVAVYSSYASAMAGSWDYDDVRLAAVALAEAAGERPGAAPDTLIVDGLREVGPLELRTFKALARYSEVHLTLPRPPDGEPPTTVLEAAWPIRIDRYRAPNPVAEVRWVMRSLKADLAVPGTDPLDLAVIATPGHAGALLALADEYGVPLMDETPAALAETPAGRTLLDLLELAHAPTASRLLALPALAPVAAAALELGVAGVDGLTAVARELGQERTLSEWLARLNVQGEPLEWARDLVTGVLRTNHPDMTAAFEETVLRMAQEASRLAAGEGFQRWWAALLRDARTARRQRGGVALLDATLASGRQFAKAYLVGAVEGAYGANEREEYFTPEDDRVAGAVVGALPQRLQGRDALVAAELMSRARHLVITAPAADRSGPLVSDAVLGDQAAATLPALAAGSRLELPAAAPYRPGFDGGRLGDADVEYLRDYAECALRAWATRHLPPQPGPQPLPQPLPRLAPRPTVAADELPPWSALVSALLERPRLTDERLAELSEAYPEARSWLAQHAPRLLALRYRQAFPDARSGVAAIIDAGERVPAARKTVDTAAAAPAPSAPGGREKVVVYRFVEPHPAPDWEWAVAQLRDRWTEYLAAALALRHPSRAPLFVEFVVWPVYGAPVVVETSQREIVRGRIDAAADGVVVAARRFAGGDLTPTPGYACRSCVHHAVCRVGERS